MSSPLPDPPEARRQAPSRESRRWARAGGGLLLAWGVMVPFLYVILGEADVLPSLRAIGARSLDLLVPVLLLVAHLPLASAFLRRFGGQLSPSDHLLLGLPLALGGIILGVTLSGALGLLAPLTLAALAAASPLLFAREWPRIAASAREVWGRRGGWGSPAAAFVAAGLAGASLLMTLTPAASQDALHYHLAVPSLWLDAGGFVPVSGNIYSHFPMNGEMLFLEGLALRGEIGAKVFHWIALVGCALLVRRLAGRWVGARSASWAVVIFLSVPTIFRVASWAYVELFVVLFLLAAWLAWERGEAEGGPASGWLLGSLLGLGCGTKYTVLLPAVALAAVAVARSAPRRRWHVAGTGLLAALLTGGFWYLRNLVFVGNPVFPFLYSWWGGEGWDAERAALYLESLKEWGRGGWSLPFDVVFRSQFGSVQAFDGRVGPVFLLGLPLVGLAAFRRKECRPLAAFTALLVISWVSTTHQIRFLVPALAFLSILIPVGWECLQEAFARRVVRTTCILAALIVLPTHLLLFLVDAPLAFAVGLESEDEIRARTFPGGDYDLFRRIPEVVPEDGRILFAASGSPVFACSRPYHADSVVENHTLRRLLAAGPNPADVAGAFRREGFTHLLFRFSLVFGEASDLTGEEQGRLRELLNSKARLALRSGDSFLFEFLPDGKGRRG